MLLILKMQRPKDRERMALEKEEWREEKLTKVKLFFKTLLIFCIICFSEQIKIFTDVY